VLDEEPELPAFPEGTPPEVVAMLGSMLEEVMPEQPGHAPFQGTECYCPDHADLLPARLSFPDRQLWAEMDPELGG